MNQPTYARNALPVGRKDRVQCPCCLRDIRTKKDGSMTRHGWKEEGRIMGSYGNGLQWGECRGWGMRPLEETDRDALVIIDEFQKQIERATRELDEHEEGWTSYKWVHTHKYWSYRDKQAGCKRTGLPFHVALKSAIVELGLYVEDREAQHKLAPGYYQPAYRYSVAVPKGYEGATIMGRDIHSGSMYGMKVEIPSYETMRARYIDRLHRYIESAKASQEAIRKAIEHHRENPPSWASDYEVAV